MSKSSAVKHKTSQHTSGGQEVTEVVIGPTLTRCDDTATK